MLTAKDLTLLNQIEMHCEKCIRACVYAKAVNCSSVNMWAFTQNCFAEAAILHWCKVFGSNNEPTHYTKYFKDNCISMPDGSKLTMDLVRSRLYSAANMTEDEYNKFWKNLKKGRDQYFVHNEFSIPKRGKFPDLDVLKRVAVEMRNVIYDVVSHEKSEDLERHRSFQAFLFVNQNNKYLQDLKSDCAQFKSMMKTNTRTEPGA